MGPLWWRWGRSGRCREAWESGGWQWPPDRRRQFGRWEANLTPTRDCVNRSKGASDPAEWAGTVKTGTCQGLAATAATAPNPPFLPAPLVTP